MKVGDRIRVFEILKNGCYGYADLIGLQRPEMYDEYFNHKYGVNLLTKDKSIFDFPHHCNIDNNIVKAGHVKHVCTMVIKSIKQ